VSKDDGGSTPQVSRWVGVIGLFVAPTTIITSVCIYFGFVSTRKFLSYFGIDSNAIGFTSTDHVIKSISVLYAPILMLLIAWTALLWAGEYTRRLAKAGRHTMLIRRLGWTTIVIGALGLLRGIVGVLLPQLSVFRSSLLTPVALGLGMVLTLIGCWLLGTLRTETTPRAFAAAQRASMFVAAAVLLMALFWLTNIFATVYGENEAQSTAAKLWAKEEGVILDTTDRLNPPQNLLLETKLAVPSASGDESVTYRYECFRSLVVRGDQWVLVPAKWTPEYGYAVIVADDSSNRISVTRIKGIADTGAANWDASNRPGGWQCPEVAPASAYGAAPNSSSPHS
jgi:hypothetical protein